MRIDVNWILGSALLFLVGFFAPWGLGLQQLSSFDFSKIFVVLMFLTILIWFVRFRCKVIFPRYFNYFILFFCLHTFITYFIFYRDEFTFGSSQAVGLNYGFYKMVEPKGSIVMRHLLFILFSYSLAALLYQTGRIFPLMIGNMLGVICSSEIGGYHMYYRSFDQTRLAGGGLDPNAFGLIAVGAFFGGVISLYQLRNNLFMRVIIVLLLLFTIYFVYATGSRGALLGLIIGSLVMIFKLLNNLKNRINFILLFLFFAVLVSILIPKDDSLSINERMSPSQMIEDRGTMRLDIWSTYLSEFPKYAFTGLGLEHSNEEIVTTQLGQAYVTHNTYLQVLVEFGLIGITLFILMINQLWKRVAIQNRSVFANVPPACILGLFSSWLFISFFLNVFQERETWIILAVVAAFSLKQKEVITV